MSISISGLGSGIDYESWITQLVAIKQAKIDDVKSQVNSISKSNSTLSALQNTYTTLQTKMQAITDAQYSSTDNIFTQKDATSSSVDISAIADATASVQSINVSVSQLATATKAQSASVIGKTVDSTTLVSDVSQGSITAGSLSFYIDGTKSTINIASTDTLGTVMTNIQGLGLNASISNGQLTVSANGISTLSIGSSSDTTNFSNVMGLVKNVGESYTSSKSIFETDPAVDITTAKFASGPVTAGTFTIGGSVFTISAGTTMNSLVSSINKDANAGVTAYWDPNAGKLVMNANDQGAININIQSGTSNFTDVMGLTSAGVLATGSQTLGTNAKLNINGTNIVSSSNTVTSDISGITGLTLTLNNTTTSTATIDVTSDNTKLTTALTDFVGAFNDMLGQTNISVGAGGVLHGESILSMIENKLRSDVTASVVGSNGYKTLASIGITTGPFSVNTSADTSKLVIDKTKMAEALKTDPQAVMKLLVGDSTTGDEGVLTKLDTVVTNAINPLNGYFSKREDSYGIETSSLNKTIISMTSELSRYKASLETKFQAMDKLISSLKSQSDQISQLLGNLNGTNSSSK